MDDVFGFIKMCFFFLKMRNTLGPKTMNVIMKIISDMDKQLYLKEKFEAVLCRVLYNM